MIVVSLTVTSYNPRSQYLKQFIYQGLIRDWPAISCSKFPVSFNIGVCLPYYMRFEAIIIIYDNITAKGWFFAFGLCKPLSGQDRIYFRFPTNPVELFYL